MNTLLKAPRAKAASAPARGQVDLPQRIPVANDDIPIRKPIIEVLVRSGHQVDAAEALRLNTGYQHGGINE